MVAQGRSVAMDRNNWTRVVAKILLGNDEKRHFSVVQFTCFLSGPFFPYKQKVWVSIKLLGSVSKQTHCELTLLCMGNPFLGLRLDTVPLL